MRNGALQRTAAYAFITTFSILAMMFVLSSCSFLPVEEEPPPAPILRSYEKTEYKFAEVTRGDIVESVRITCQYSPAVEQTLSFSVSNLPVVNVYVTRGDLVKAGDILAELDSSDIDAQIEAAQLYLKRLKLELSRRVKIHELDLKAETLKLESLTEKYQTAEDSVKPAIYDSIENQNQIIASLIDNHNKQAEIFDIRISASKLKLSELQEQKSKRTLVSGIDGTVTYLKETGPNTLSVEKEKFITIADKSTSVFIVSGKDAKYFSPGDEVTVQLSGEFRDATVIDAKDLNLEPSDVTAYIQLNETAFDIKENATGVITIELDRRDDVIYVASTAIKMANGKSIVYVLDDNEIKTLKEVVTGFAADNKTEIVSGLEPGDLVIIE
ncbi:MAG: efflux RND transporter periplasmic adaptor subunit [Eubacteriales bacterium]|jgi:macrolide-specific efflux system membrane fusion protein